MAGNNREPLRINTNLADCFNLGGKFTDLHPVGFGANGLVFSAKYKHCDKKVAIKRIGFNDKVSCRYALREIRVLRHLCHDNVVPIYAMLALDGTNLNNHTPTEPSNLQSVFIVQELLDTDLHHVLQSNHLNLEHVELLLYQLLRGLKYIHSANVLHRDLKPSNLLLNCQDLTLKIGDFGLARILDPKYDHKGFLSDNVGTCWYRSPELILTPNDYTSHVDMWSAGCIFAEMLVGRPLFPGANDLDVMCLVLDTLLLEPADWDHVLQIMPNKVLKNHPLCVRTPLREKLSTFNEQALDLLEKMLTFNPAKRVSAIEALAHPFLQHLACETDEPVALRPFCIESEVDDLSPTSLKQMIISEGAGLHKQFGHTFDNDRWTNLQNPSWNIPEQSAAYQQISHVSERKVLVCDPCSNNSDVTESLKIIENENSNVDGGDVILIEETIDNNLTLEIQEDKCSPENLGEGSKSDIKVDCMSPQKGIFNYAAMPKLSYVNLNSDNNGGTDDGTFLMVKKKDAEKCEDNEKDEAEISTKKLEEDQEIQSLLSQNESSKNNEAEAQIISQDLPLEDVHWEIMEQHLAKEMDIWQWMADVDREREKCEESGDPSLFIDVEFPENHKEYSKPSPKELENLFKQESKNLKNERFLHPDHHPKNCQCNLCSEEREHGYHEDDNKQMYILDGLESRSSSKESLVLGARARSPAQRSDSGESEGNTLSYLIEKDLINQCQKLRLGDGICEDYDNMHRSCRLGRIRPQPRRRILSQVRNDLGSPEDVSDFPCNEIIPSDSSMRDRLNSLEQLRLKRLIDRKNQSAPFPLYQNNNRHHHRWNHEDPPPQQELYNRNMNRNRYISSLESSSVPSTHSTVMDYESINCYIPSYNTTGHNMGASNYFPLHPDSEENLQGHQDRNVSNQNNAGAKPKKRSSRKQKAL